MLDPEAKYEKLAEMYREFKIMRTLTPNQTGRPIFKSIVLVHAQWQKAQLEAALPLPSPGEEVETEPPPS